MNNVLDINANKETVEEICQRIVAAGHDDPRESQKEALRGRAFQETPILDFQEIDTSKLVSDQIRAHEIVEGNPGILRSSFKRREERGVAPMRDPIFVIEVTPGVFKIQSGHNRLAAWLLAYGTDHPIPAIIVGEPITCEGFYTVEYAASLAKADANPESKNVSLSGADAVVILIDIVQADPKIGCPLTGEKRFPCGDFSKMPRKDTKEFNFDDFCDLVFPDRPRLSTETVRTQMHNKMLRTLNLSRTLEVKAPEMNQTLVHYGLPGVSMRTKGGTLSRQTYVDIGTAIDSAQQCVSLVYKSGGTHRQNMIGVFIDAWHNGDSMRANLESAQVEHIDIVIGIKVDESTTVDNLRKLKKTAVEESLRSSKTLAASGIPMNLRSICFPKHLDSPHDEYERVFLDDIPEMYR